MNNYNLQNKLDLLKNSISKFKGNHHNVDSNYSEYNDNYNRGSVITNTLKNSNIRSVVNDKISHYNSNINDDIISYTSKYNNGTTNNNNSLYDNLLKKMTLEKNKNEKLTEVINILTNKIELEKNNYSINNENKLQEYRNKNELNKSNNNKLTQLQKLKADYINKINNNKSKISSISENIKNYEKENNIIKEKLIKDTEDIKRNIYELESKIGGLKKIYIITKENFESESNKLERDFNFNKKQLISEYTNMIEEAELCIKETEDKVVKLEKENYNIINDHNIFENEDLIYNNDNKNKIINNNYEEIKVIESTLQDLIKEKNIYIDNNNQIMDNIIKLEKNSNLTKLKYKKNIDKIKENILSANNKLFELESKYKLLIEENNIILNNIETNKAVKFEISNKISDNIKRYDNEVNTINHNNTDKINKLKKEIEAVKNNIISYNKNIKEINDDNKRLNLNYNEFLGQLKSNIDKKIINTINKNNNF